MGSVSQMQNFWYDEANIIITISLVTFTMTIQKGGKTANNLKKNVGPHI